VNRVTRLAYRAQLTRVILRFGAHNLRRSDLVNLSDHRLEQVARQVLLVAKASKKITELVRSPARHEGRRAR
jgi:hypothetical protein